MRLSRLLSCVLLVAACGDNGSGTNKLIDAAHNTDKDSAVEPDSPNGPADHSRVWAWGNYIDNTKMNGAKFDNGDTLPVPVADAAFPAGASVFSSAAIRQNVFDATATKTAFIADMTTAGTFDIYVADKDGANATVIVPAAAGVVYQGVALSPDGTKVAYLADPILSGMFDLFVISTDGTGTAVKVSPNRTVPNASNLDVFHSVTWSADSKFLAFSGGLTVSTISEAFVVDTTQAAPVAVTLLASADVTSPGVGTRGFLNFDDQNNVYYRAALTAAAGPFTFFKVGPDGNNKVTNPSFIPKRGDNSAPDVGAFQTSADGKTLIFSADAPALGAYNLYSVTLAGADPAVNLTGVNASPAAGTVHTDFSLPMWFSPDGKSIAAAANYLGTRDEPYVIALDGSGMKRIASIDAACGACDTTGIQWSADSKTVFAIGDLTTNNNVKVYKLDPKMTDQAPTLAVDTVAPAGNATGGFFGLIVH